MAIRVFIVEDDPMVEKINRSYVDQVEGFQVVGSARTLWQARETIRNLEPELVLLDIYLPDDSGLRLLRDIRQSDLKTDVIVITAAHDTSTVSRAIRYGAFDYLIKPFDFPRLRQALENYRNLHVALDQQDTLTQEEIDFFKKAGTANAGPGIDWPATGLPAKDNDARSPAPLANGPVGAGRKAPSFPPSPLPKNIDPITLQRTQEVLISLAEPTSAEEVGKRLGVTRITARRYLEYLVSIDRAEISLFYGTVGRPIRRYGPRVE
ncbi:MAG: response regulator [Firmicutes bacterium]|nr:response regulator [Bacillota bacterium]